MSKKILDTMPFPARKFFLIGGCIMEFLLAINILWSCSSTFDCKEFLPTISYLACYKGHDRLFNFTMMYWGMYLLSFTLISFIQFRTKSRYLNLSFLFVSVIICILQPCIGIIDEANSSHIVKIEKIHAGMMIGLILFSLYWIILTNHIKKIEGFLYNYIFFGTIMLLWSVLQWFYAEYNGIIFNYFFEAISEWVTISFAVFLPYAYSCTFKQVVFRVAKS